MRERACLRCERLGDNWRQLPCNFSRIQEKWVLLSAVAERIARCVLCRWECFAHLLLLRFVIRSTPPTMRLLYFFGVWHFEVQRFFFAGRNTQVQACKTFIWQLFWHCEQTCTHGISCTCQSNANTSFPASICESEVCTLFYEEATIWYTSILSAAGICIYLHYIYFH